MWPSLGPKHCSSWWETRSSWTRIRLGKSKTIKTSVNLKLYWNIRPIVSSCLCLRFMRYCELEQGYTGFDYKDAEGEEDVVTRLASLKITSDGTQLSDLKSYEHYNLAWLNCVWLCTDIDESPLQQHVHTEWGNEHWGPIRPINYQTRQSVYCKRNEKFICYFNK